MELLLGRPERRGARREARRPRRRRLLRQVPGALEDGYAAILELIERSGKRLVDQAGVLPDIGVKKRFLTAEDLRIERALAALVAERFPGDGFFAEEENDEPPCELNYWVCDPISGTRTFLAGLAHFGVAVARVVDGHPAFAAVYDPTMDELFSAQRGEGARRNGELLQVSEEPGTDGPRVLFNLTYGYRDPAEARRVWEALLEFDLWRNTNSFGVNYGHVATGRYDGFVSLTKDAFPEVPGSLFLREAGGEFYCLGGAPEVEPKERRFFGGAPWLVAELRRVLEPVLS